VPGLRTAPLMLTVSAVTSWALPSSRVAVTTWERERRIFMARAPQPWPASISAVAAPERNAGCCDAPGQCQAQPNTGCAPGNSAPACECTPQCAATGDLDP